MMKSKMALMALVIVFLASLGFASVSSGQTQVSLIKEVNETSPEPGDSITYTIEVFTPLRLQPLVITDTLPSGVTRSVEPVASYVEAMNVTGSVAIQGPQITWTIAPQNPFAPMFGTSFLEIQVTVDNGVAPGTVITNTAQITGMSLSANAMITVADGGNTPPSEPEPEEPEIDIKPGSDENPINPGSNGVVPVAILGSETFDVTEIDGESIVFGPNEAKPVHGGGHLEDVNGDGFIDWLGHFRVQDIGIVFDENNKAELTLKGDYDDTSFEASDIVTRAGNPGKTKTAKGAPGLHSAGITTWGSIKTR